MTAGANIKARESAAKSLGQLIETFMTPDILPEKVKRQVFWIDGKTKQQEITEAVNQMEDAAFEVKAVHIDLERHRITGKETRLILGMATGQTHIFDLADLRRKYKKPETEHTWWTVIPEDYHEILLKTMWFGIGLDKDIENIPYPYSHNVLDLQAIARATFNEEEFAFHNDKEPSMEKYGLGYAAGSCSACRTSPSTTTPRSRRSRRRGSTWPSTRSPTCWRDPEESCDRHGRCPTSSTPGWRTTRRSCWPIAAMMR